MAKPKQSQGRPSKVSLQRAQQSLNERQIMYVAWEAMPEKHRQPATRAELAKELGVSEVTCWRWSKDPKIQAAVRWMVMHHAGDPVRVSNVVNFIYETVMDDSQQMRLRMEAARDFLKAVGVHQVFKSKPELLTVKDVDEINLDELSDDEIWELYNERAGNNGDRLPGGDSGGFEPVLAIGGPVDDSVAVDDDLEAYEGQVVVDGNGG